MTVDCGVEVNHAVLLIGYGTSADGIDFWLCKNSWGTGWGESGFFRVKRLKDDGPGIQGILQYSVYGSIRYE